jgi:carotenoid cleavage dioxygenase
MPTEVSPEDLSTKDVWDFGGEVKLPAFTAHPRIDPKTGELMFAAYSFFETETAEPGVHIGVVDPDGVLKHFARIPSADRNTLMHDCAITEKWTVITDFPLCIDPSKLLTEEGLISFQPSAGSRLGLAPRYGSEVKHWFEVQNGYAFHLMGAYEDGDDVVLRGCRSPSMSLGLPYEDGSLDREAFVRTHVAEGWKAGPLGGKLHEWRLHLKDGSVTEREVGSGALADFPVINPAYEGQKYHYGYCSVGKLEESIPEGVPVFGAVEKYMFADDGEVAVERHVLPEGCAAGELTFVPKPGAAAEDAGWMLLFTTDAESRSEMRILDAQDFGGPPVARIALPQRVPFGFHGTWVPGA